MNTRKFTLSSTDNSFELSQEELASLEMTQYASGNWHIIEHGVGHKAQVEICVKTRFASVRLDGRYYQFEVKDELDQLVEALGMNKVDKVYDQHVLAPMPGLVLSILVKEGEVVERDTPLLILEAMKMENVIKSAARASIESIECSLKSPVEKGQLLIKLGAV